MRLVTAYCLSYGHWTVIPRQLDESFKDMADCGFNAVALSFSESEMQYSRRAFEVQVRLAHQAGLKVLVIPSRLGGRFAGAPLMPRMWVCQHPASQVPGQVGLACLENQAFRDWVKEFMATLLSDYPLDGIVWDEPKVYTDISTHPDTLAKFGPRPTVDDMDDGFVDFLQDLTSHCLEINPKLLITLFNMGTTSQRFTRQSTAIEGIHYAGYDGNLSRQSFFHEEPAWLKYRLESVWQRTIDECRQANKKTFALVENMLMPAAAIAEYEVNLDAYLANYRPDHLSLYYYAHNNEDPDRVHAVTRQMMKKHL